MPLTLEQQERNRRSHEKRVALRKHLRQMAQDPDIAGDEFYMPIEIYELVVLKQEERGMVKMRLGDLLQYVADMG